MNDDRDAPLETMWQGKYISALKRGRWEFVSRTGSTNAVVIVSPTATSPVALSDKRAIAHAVLDAVLETRRVL